MLTIKAVRLHESIPDDSRYDGDPGPQEYIGRASQARPTSQTSEVTVLSLCIEKPTLRGPEQQILLLLKYSEKCLPAALLVSVCTSRSYLKSAE